MDDVDPPEDCHCKTACVESDSEDDYGCPVNEATFVAEDIIQGRSGAKGDDVAKSQNQCSGKKDDLEIEAIIMSHRPCKIAFSTVFFKILFRLPYVGSVMNF